MLRALVQSKLWVALGAAVLCAETYSMCGEWLRWTMIVHVFFLTWVAYLFVADENFLWRKRLVPLALTGVLVTFQGFEQLQFPLMCAAIVLLYRMHWLPDSVLNRLELRKIPLMNNLVITGCWMILCHVWPLMAMGKSLHDYSLYMASNACWIFALSLGEDFILDEPSPDVTLRFLGRRLHRWVALLFVVMAMVLQVWNDTPYLGVWISLVASFLLLAIMPYGKRTMLKSWLLDAVLMLRVWR